MHYRLSYWLATTHEGGEHFIAMWTLKACNLHSKMVNENNRKRFFLPRLGALCIFSRKCICDSYFYFSFTFSVLVSLCRKFSNLQKNGAIINILFNDIFYWFLFKVQSQIFVRQKKIPYKIVWHTIWRVWFFGQYHHFNKHLSAFFNSYWIVQ